MKAAVLVFPGSNCDRDLAVAFEQAGADVTMVWHKDNALPDGVDIVGVPGGFSYGDYLRCGAIAANSPITRSLKAHADRGGYVLGICNGFQILTETGLLPGALLRNAGLKYICKHVDLKVETSNSAFTEGYNAGDVLSIPIAHHDGNYFASEDKLKQLEDEGRVAFRYVNESGEATPEANPNGSQNNIAGIYSKSMKVLGLMPHPERLISKELGGTDGRGLFESLVEALH